MTKHRYLDEVKAKNGLIRRKERFQTDKKRKTNIKKS